MKKSLFLLPLVLCACAQTSWENPGVSKEQRMKDAYECEKDMRQSGHYGSGLDGAAAARTFGERCLFSKGYKKITTFSDGRQTVEP